MPYFVINQNTPWNIVALQVIICCCFFFQDVNETIKALNRTISEYELVTERLSGYDVTIETLLDNVASFGNQLANVQRDVTLNNQRTRRIEELAQKVTELEERVIRKFLIIFNRFLHVSKNVFIQTCLQAQIFQTATDVYS